jgi:hypothetical protein
MNPKNVTTPRERQLEALVDNLYTKNQRLRIEIRNLEEDGAQISQENARIKEELGLLKKREAALSMDNHFLKEVEIKSLKEGIIRLQQRREDDLQNLQKIITTSMRRNSK